jgi:hypothetical protein
MDRTEVNPLEAIMKTPIPFRSLALLLLAVLALSWAVWIARGCPEPPPILTVTASAPTASEVGPVNGTFTITRSGGNQALPLTVYYLLSGTATNGTDYQTLSGWVQIKANTSSTNIIVTPIADTDCEGNETVILTLLPYPYYDVGTPSTATVTITDPPNCDSDGDGLPDWWEMQHFNTLLKTSGGDEDGDGLTNIQEYRLGTDPTSYDSLNGLTSGNGLQVFTPLK